MIQRQEFSSPWRNPLGKRLGFSVYYLGHRHSGPDISVSSRKRTSPPSSRTGEGCGCDVVPCDTSSRCPRDRLLTLGFSGLETGSTPLYSTSTLPRRVHDSPFPYQGQGSLDVTVVRQTLSLGCFPGLRLHNPYPPHDIYLLFRL